MIIVTSFSQLPVFSPPCGLTIGNFDGVHRGHQFLLKQLQEKTTSKGTAAVFTFSNHPSKVLSQRSPTPLITSLEHKLNLFEKMGIGLVILFEFTPSFANQTYRDFLTKLHQAFPFRFLVLGEGASLGKNREGDATKLRELGRILHFELHLVQKLSLENHALSSGKIREEILNGNLKQVELLLGRPFSIYRRLEKDSDFKGRLCTQGLCLPPEGTYSVKIVKDEISLAAKARLQREYSYLILESDSSLQKLSDLYVEIIF